MLTLIKTRQETDIYRQIAQYVEKKAHRSTYQANQQKEWLLLFVKVTNVSNVFKISREDERKFLEFLYKEYPANYQVEGAKRTLNCFKRFYRHRL